MFKRLKSFLNFLDKDTGISSVEYGVLLAFITASLVAVVTAFSTAAGTFYEAACAVINGGAC